MKAKRCVSDVIGACVGIVMFCTAVSIEYAYYRLRGQTPWFVVRGAGR